MKKLSLILGLGFIAFQLHAQNTSPFPTTGNVGIGTTSPNKELEIKGGDGIGIRLYNDQANTWDILNTLYGKLDFVRGGSNTHMRIDQHGNVGIGTTNVIYRTTIDGDYSRGTGLKHIMRLSHTNALDSGDGTSLLLTNRGHGTNDYGGYMALVSTGSNPSYLNPRLDFAVQNPNTHQLVDITTKMSILGNGNVGVGTTNPSEKIEVMGNGASIKLSTASDPTNYSLKLTSNYDYGNKFSFQYGTNVFLQEKQVSNVGQSTNSKLYLSNYYGIGFCPTTDPANENDVALFIAGNGNAVQKGNVGIGTTIPDAKLAVKGNIHTQEVKVDLLGAVMPDYVFTSNYDLKTLTEVEAYIKANGHLPNIPSAKEAEVNGLLLKDMNLKLLEKIEELTLYTIQQEKRIEGLEQENNILKDNQERIALLEQKIEQLLKK